MYVMETRDRDRVTALDAVTPCFDTANMRAYMLK